MDGREIIGTRRGDNYNIDLYNDLNKLNPFKFGKKNKLDIYFYIIFLKIIIFDFIFLIIYLFTFSLVPLFPDHYPIFFFIIALHLPSLLPPFLPSLPLLYTIQQTQYSQHVTHTRNTSHNLCPDISQF